MQRCITPPTHHPQPNYLFQTRLVGSTPYNGIIALIMDQLENGMLGV